MVSKVAAKLIQENPDKIAAVLYEATKKWAKKFYPVAATEQAQAISDYLSGAHGFTDTGKKELCQLFTLVTGEKIPFMHNSIEFRTGVVVVPVKEGAVIYYPADQPVIMGGWYLNPNGSSTACLDQNGEIGGGLGTLRSSMRPAGKPEIENLVKSIVTKNPEHLGKILDAVKEFAKEMTDVEEE